MTDLSKATIQQLEDVKKAEYELENADDSNRKTLKVNYDKAVSKATGRKN
jgi:hypothetical protein